MYNKIEIYTDGSSKQKPAKAIGSGCIIVQYEKETDIQGHIILEKGRGHLEGSNQTAELYGILIAASALCEMVKANELASNAFVRIVSDSKYSIGCITQWRKMWQNPGIYDQSTGISLIKVDKHICNWELINQIWEEMDRAKALGLNIYFCHVRGHGKNPLAPARHIWGNDLADKMATKHSFYMSRIHNMQ